MGITQSNGAKVTKPFLKKEEMMLVDNQAFSPPLAKETRNNSSLYNQKQDGQILSDLQQQTLLRIFCVCPRPSTAVINMISNEMNLPKDIILDFFVQRKIQDSTIKDTNIAVKKKEKKTVTL